MNHAMLETADQWLGAEAAGSVPRARKSARRQTAAPAMTSRDERQLIEKLRAGDEATFNELVDRHHGALIRVARNYVADLSVAEEVVQEAWLGVLEGIERFQGRSSLKSWIISIVIHKAKDRGVREKRYVAMAANGYDDAEEPVVDPSRFRASGEWGLPPQQWDELTPERLLESRESLDLLQQAIAELPANLREVLVLRDIEELDSKDICAQLRITESNLYVRLHRARERVRAALEPQMGAGGR
jgi:RNA polymerase sigma-70 factor (ECF subfamily)